LNITSIVLAGGRSSRFGKEKHVELIAGKTLIERTIDLLSTLSDEILIVISNRQSKTSFSSYSRARTVVDLKPGKGSLGGIYTGLVYSNNYHSIVVACDMPFLNIDLLNHMISMSADYDVIIPCIDGLMEPLHAVYSKNCVSPMKKLLESENHRIVDFFGSVRVKYIDKNEISRFDPDNLSFFNINTQSDLEKAQSLAAQNKAAHSEINNRGAE